MEQTLRRSVDDMHQDIARSSYADMVHDDERNRAYLEAIRVNVTSLVRSRELNPYGFRYYNCCDIGTGSGLLSMMVARAFLDLDYKHFHIKAFECFKPMANCARNIIESNLLSSYITVIPRRAELAIEEVKFDLLVAELLDTELIGEGCLEVYRHAVNNLCSPTCLFIPCQARIYIEPVASSLLFQRHVIDDYAIHLDDGKEVLVKVDSDIKNCPGMPNVDDIQASALQEGVDFHRFSEPQVVFDFKFNDISTIQANGSVEVEFPVKRKIEQPPVLVMWWDIVMYDRTLNNLDTSGLTENSLILSCAPTWARTEAQLKNDKLIKELYGRDVWREHWLQGVYYFPDIQMAKQLVNLSEEVDITVYAFHDDYSLWFSLQPPESANGRSSSPPGCSCGVHRYLNRYQVAFLSCKEQLSKLLRVRLANITSTQPIVGRLQFRQGPTAHVCNAPPEEAAANWRILFPRLSTHTNPVSLVDLSLQDQTSWEKIMLRFFKRRSMEYLRNFQIKCTQVHFDNLCRIKMDVGDCEGFNLRYLDEMLNRSSDLVDKAVESHHLWEYTCKRIDDDHVIFSTQACDIGKQRAQIADGTYWKHLKLPLRYPDEWLKKGWALVFWAELKLEWAYPIRDKETLSTGPIEPCKLNETIKWNKLTQQKVHFLHDHPLKNADGIRLTSVEVDVGLTSSGEINVQRAYDYNNPPKSIREINFDD